MTASPEPLVAEADSSASALADQAEGAPDRASKPARKSAAAPVRTCVVTRAALAPDEGVRFALSPDGVVTPDIKRKLPGRGVWTSGRAAVVAQAQRRGAFARAFRAPAQASPTLAQEVDALLARDCLQSLAMANKAGRVTTGYMKTEGVLAAGEAVAILAASDGGADGKRKLAQAARRHCGGKTPPVVESFARAELDLALGRTNVIHAALKAGPASDAFLARWRRLTTYRAAEGDKAEADPSTERPSAFHGETAVEADGEAGVAPCDETTKTAPGDRAPHSILADASTEAGARPGSAQATAAAGTTTKDDWAQAPGCGTHDG